jgi:hypothetical protein
MLGLFTASISIKAVLLLLEAKGKRGYLKPPYNRFSPESTSAIFNQSFFWWLNPVLVTGFQKILTLDDLFTIDSALLSEPLQYQMQSSWDKCACPSNTVCVTDNFQMLCLASMHWFMRYPAVSDGVWCRLFFHAFAWLHSITLNHSSSPRPYLTSRSRLQTRTLAMVSLQRLALSIWHRCRLASNIADGHHSLQSLDINSSF